MPYRILKGPRGTHSDYRYETRGDHTKTTHMEHTCRYTVTIHREPTWRLLGNHMLNREYVEVTR